jgi:hypothetical protein
MAAFSAADFERFPRFYTEDVLLELGSVPQIHGRQGITSSVGEGELMPVLRSYRCKQRPTIQD